MKFLITLAHALWPIIPKGKIVTPPYPTPDPPYTMEIVTHSQLPYHRNKATPVDGKEARTDPTGKTYQVPQVPPIHSHVVQVQTTPTTDFLSPTTTTIPPANQMWYTLLFKTNTFGWLLK